VTDELIGCIGHSDARFEFPGRRCGVVSIGTIAFVAVWLSRATC
jgi:hypothetical protein